MSLKVCLAVKALSFPWAGGHLWVYLNWALALRSLGWDVVWMEAVSTTDQNIEEHFAALKARLEPFGLADSIALYAKGSGRCLSSNYGAPVSVGEALRSDLLLNFGYDDVPAALVASFRRSALVDIDPGQTQVWMSGNYLKLPQHDIYFTIGETVGSPGSRFPNCCIDWQYTPPPVFVPEWPVTPCAPSAPYTTVSNWWGNLFEFRGESFLNGKRDIFMKYVDLPSRVATPLELALCLYRNTNQDKEDRKLLQDNGWSVQEAWERVSTPHDYRTYVQQSRGEFSCVKPACIFLQNAWISDRTLCYLASGKPAIVQDTGPSRFLPKDSGLFRFQNIDEAARYLERASEDYEHHCRVARELAIEYFDAQKVVGHVLEVAM
ncbi:MAG: hypothetical protein DMG17_23055 [Acidobacteria bacterium]|nr:MAG: hypothetical protein DMG17_23055 [Acidobacteriota bacterium]